MKTITRRNFIKAVFVSAGILSFPGGAVKLLEAYQGDTVQPWFANTQIETDTIRLFMSELSMYPKGSAAHSVGNVEVLPGAIVGDDFESYPMIRGLSFAKAPQKAKYWAFVFDESRFMQDIDFRRKMIDDMLHEVTRAWKRDGVAYWDTPYSVNWGPSVPARIGN